MQEISFWIDHLDLSVPSEGTSETIEDGNVEENEKMVGYIGFRLCDSKERVILQWLNIMHLHEQLIRVSSHRSYNITEQKTSSTKKVGNL